MHQPAWPFQQTHSNTQDPMQACSSLSETKPPSQGRGMAQGLLCRQGWPRQLWCLWSDEWKETLIWGVVEGNTPQQLQPPARPETSEGFTHNVLLQLTHLYVSHLVLAHSAARIRLFTPPASPDTISADLLLLCLHSLVQQRRTRWDKHQWLLFMSVAEEKLYESAS